MIDYTWLIISRLNLLGRYLAIRKNSAFEIIGIIDRNALISDPLILREVGRGKGKITNLLSASSSLLSRVRR